MADERTKPPYNQARLIPENYNWQKLKARDGVSKSVENLSHPTI
jgi:hypothetical protein